jgi:hypothetical protein
MTSTLAIAITVAGSLSGCASTSIAHLSGPEWMREAGRMGGSMNSTYYIGCSGSRAYLESWRMTILAQHGQTTVYWTDISELPDDIASKITAERFKPGVGPWK